MENHGKPPVLKVPLKGMSDVDPPYKEWDDVVLPIDFLLIAAKNPEFLSCYPCLQNPFQSSLYGLGMAYFGDMGETEPKLKVALMRCNEGGGVAVGSLSTVLSAVTKLRPKGVICVGFAGGLDREKVKLGDVVISSKLIAYAHKKVTNDRDGTKSRGVIVPASPEISKLILNAGNGWIAPLEDPKARDVKVLCDDAFLSGPELVDSGWRREELLKLHPEAVAIEMEGEGVFAAAHDLNIEWVVIKGISDKADGTKAASKEWRPFASAMAASLVKHFLRYPSVFRKWPHFYQGEGGSNQLQGAAGGSNQLQGNLGDFLQELMQSNLTVDQDDCKTGQLVRNGRNIYYQARRNAEDPSVFEALAWDIETPQNLKFGKTLYKEPHEAINHAVDELIADLKEKGIILID